MMVSVHMITYNHEKYVADAIKSVLMQETDFPIQLIISDDCSTDNTRQIIEEYASKYPNLIQPVFREKNIGSLANFIDTFKYCEGKYIALCEGDDYWSDPHKLAMQVKVLNDNPNYIGCYHNTEERYEESATKASYLYSNFSSGRVVNFTDLAAMNYIPTCSAVFRKINPEQLPEWYRGLKLGDWTLHLINSLKGDYWYIPKIMAVHRLHSESAWMLQDPKRNERFVIETYDVMIASQFFDKSQTAHLKLMKRNFEQQHSLKNRMRRFIYKIIN